MIKRQQFDLQNRIRIITHVSIFAALTAIGAFIKIPFPYVPLTLQTFFVLLSGNLLGARFGALSQVIYLSIGLMGLPIFAYGGGPGYIFQPTFGYLLAYPLVAFVSGSFMPMIFNSKFRIKHLFFKICSVNFVSILVVFIIGVNYLYLNVKYVVGKEISYVQACWSGFIIFLPGDIIKLVLVSLITIRMRKYLWKNI